MTETVSSGRLRRVAKRRGVTLVALAGELGVTGTTLHNWLQRGRMPADKAALLDAGPKRGLPAVVDAEFSEVQAARRGRTATVVCRPTPEQAPLLRALLASLGVSHEG